MKGGRGAIWGGLLGCWRGPGVPQVAPGAEGGWGALGGLRHPWGGRGCGGVGIGWLWGVSGCLVGGRISRGYLGTPGHSQLPLYPPQLPPPEVPMAVAPPRLQALLGRWREKVFTLLVQLRVQEEAQRVLQAQVGAQTLGSHLGGGWGTPICLGPSRGSAWFPSGGVGVHPESWVPPEGVPGLLGPSWGGAGAWVPS